MYLVLFLQYPSLFVFVIFKLNGLISFMIVREKDVMFQNYWITGPKEIVIECYYKVFGVREERRHWRSMAVQYKLASISI